MPLQTGIFAKLLAGARAALSREQRSSLENPQTPLSYPAEWLLDIFNGGRTDSGVRVSEMTAFQVVTFLACVDLIAGKVSSLPIHVYERSFGAHGRAIHRVAYDHDLYDLVSLEPNDEMSRQTFLKVFLCHALAWSNGYAEIQRDAGNAPLGFWPRNPGKTRPIRLTRTVHLEPAPWRPFPVTLAAGEMAFETTDGVEEYDQSDLGANSSRPGRLIPMADMLHVPGISFDGRLGQSVVWLARQTLGLILATEKFGSKYFANFAKPGGMLEMPVGLTSEQKEQSKRSWMEAQGGENAHRVAMLPPGWKFTPMSHNPQEAQTQELRQFLRTEIATLFHVPVRLAGDTTTKSRGSSEQENQELLDYTLSPWVEAIKLEWKRKLFPHPNVGRVPKSPFFVDFDTTDLIRGDSASREKFYASGKQWGYLNTNDVRSFEKLNPIEEDWAEQYWMPINMTLVHTPIDPTHQDGAGNGEPGQEAPADPLERAYRRLFCDAFGRILTRSQRDLPAFTGCFAPLLFTWRDLFAAQACREMRTKTVPGAESERFLAEYLRDMQKRCSEWAADTPEAAIAGELRRAIHAARMAAYREVAAAKAKEPVLIS